ncbi:hypothetical protein FRACYDRAFT_246809 [Fragilariopsis cylindrus CCMP1102]|uniref:DUF6824 domain-containing protein n=1 Tax=Fragilariopsis cylindrus CCMP1102 TaxID=635003 RepID=A0A1E7EYM0_9STRA|nr:hypothetical protein FRACYDRAFT_246809 [Fragilariopsis cylindrus CCMP1102]|eukprot:OEU10934.1 hypothetical protein FRACYDRAFT_246809 [Fragilariopsis cylindrus CCMP1102]
MDYNNISSCNDYNDNDDDNRSTTISLRLSDISLETEKLLSDIIFQEVEEVEAKAKGVAGNTSSNNRRQQQSVTLTRVVQEEENGIKDGDEGGPNMTSSSRNNTNTNKLQRRSSILSMNTSIMSQDTADQILKSFLKISSDNNNNNNNNNYNNEQQQQQPAPGTSSSTTSSSSASPAGMMRSSSIDSNLFDEPFDQKTFFDDFDENHDDGYDDVQEKQKEIIKPIEVVSVETIHEFSNETKETKKLHEDVLAAEMEALSFDHKQKFIFDVHGMPSMIDDDSGTTENNEMFMLQQLEEELTEENIYQRNGNTTLDHDNGCAFREAQQINPDYVNSKEFRLSFLNAWMFYVDRNGKDDYVKKVVKEAARMIALHFYVKKDLFGNGEIIGRDVKLTDLNDDDREVLNNTNLVVEIVFIIFVLFGTFSTVFAAAMDSGAMQIMQNRDAAGRRVILHAPGQYSYKKLENWLRAKWYISSIIWKDQDCNNRKFGTVWINHLRGFVEQRESFETIKKLMVTTVSFPLVCKAFHWCYNDESMKALVAAKMVHFLHKYGRGRFLDHCIPDHDELCFRLETFGIPIDRKNFLPNGHLGLGRYEEWIKSRESLEASQKESNDYLSYDIDTTITIRKLDVLFGRGKSSREHVGNLRCGLLVESHLQEYNTATRFAKTQLSVKIVDMIIDAGGRFLKKDTKEGEWQEVDNESARDKRKHEKRRPPSPSHQEPGDEDHKYQKAPEGYIGRPEATS